MTSNPSTYPDQSRPVPADDQPMRTRLLALVLLVLLVFAPVALHAQPLTLGIKAGIAFPNIKGGDTPQSKGYSSRLAPNFGVFAKYGLSSRFALQGEVMFAGQGGKRNGMQPIFEENLEGLPVPPGVDLYADFQNETILNYLEIPVLACYSLTGKQTGADVFLDLGPYLGILLDAKVVTEGTSTIYVDEDGNVPLEIGGNPLPPQDFGNEVDIEGKLNKVNVGITGGIGLDFRTGTSVFRIDARGSYGFVPIQADASNGSNHTGAFYLTLGYGFNI